MVDGLRTERAAPFSLGEARRLWRGLFGDRWRSVRDRGKLRDAGHAAKLTLRERRLVLRPLGVTAVAKTADEARVFLHGRVGVAGQRKACGDPAVRGEVQGQPAAGQAWV